MRFALCLMAACCGLLSCARSTEHAVDEPVCPAVQRVSPPLANVLPEHETLAYWLNRAETQGPLDEVLLDVRQIRRHNAATGQRPGATRVGQTDLLEPVDEEELLGQVQERIEYMRAKVLDGELVDERSSKLGDVDLRAFSVPEALALVPQWRRAEGLVALRCGPRDAGLYKPPVDPDFDRNLCSSVRPGELLQLLQPWPDGMFLARTPYALGWVTERGLSAALSDAEAQAVLQADEAKPLTRRAVLQAAFEYLGKPYGWGGKDGGYDCSRFLLDLFGEFDLELPRHSATQALAGTFSIDVSDVQDLDEKRLLIEAAARRGVTLLHFPGHIMLYLGTTEQGVPMSLHAFSEYLSACPNGQHETVNRVDLVAVSDLTLGRGSSRGSFLERLSRITVLGHSPGRELVANAELRLPAPAQGPPEQCADSEEVAIFTSPRRPSASQRLRVVATSELDPESGTLILYDEEGQPHEPEVHRLDGPPFGQWVELTQPRPGLWTAVLGEGSEVLACERFRVRAQPGTSIARKSPAPAWEPTLRWERDTENLYAAFIEQLFREPDGEDVTWRSLQELIAEPGRNLLYDYRIPGEDARLELEPDCADLPYFLRAYFAWKLRLPFTYRSCTRGSKDSAPRCAVEPQGNLIAIEADDDVEAFQKFLRHVAGTVHSASARTRPRDSHTDFYPLRMDPDAIRPGTVFADPYGHLLVVARWKPQGIRDYGVLVGADAQPDGTVGRRRFWRGSFLFVPQTEQAGAGFKGWRPVQFRPAEERLRLANNQELENASEDVAWSDEQYRGTADDFYSSMEALINPRPLDAARMQRARVDALEESVSRRLSSVQNGEDYMAVHGREPIPMPKGHRIFETTGPWEDFSTPSRDMRLLISIDAVLSFPNQVASQPERFGIRVDDKAVAVAGLQRALREELARRQFTYTRSDGSSWTLSLADLVDRQQALETAYNPNDCAERRWGAAEGSEELRPCARRPPAEQRRRMEDYRSWFAARTRPPR